MSKPDDFLQLAADHTSGCLDAEGQRRLADAIEADPGACQALAIQQVLDCVLRHKASQTIDVEKIMHAVLHNEFQPLPLPLPLPLSAPVSSSNVSAKSSSPGSTRTGKRKITVRLQQRRLRTRSPWFVSFAAMLLIGCILALTVTYLSRNTSNRGVIAATVQDGTGVVWGNPPRVPSSNRIAHNTLDLRVGIAEILFPSGATVIIEGPTVIELTGPNQARLSQGRASAYVPPQASGFTLASEGLSVTDRGTAFGLSQSAHHQVQLHVFTGAVEARSPSTQTPLMMNANNAVRLDRSTGTLVPIPCSPLSFYRELHPRELTLDVVDLVAGGDGRGSGVADGIHPGSGELVSSPPIAEIPSDGIYHRVKQAPVIDGVFIPRDDQVITSQGHHFTFPPTSGKAYDIIRRGGIKTTYDHPVKQIPAIFDGVNYDTPDHTILGMHANCGFTIDLSAVAHNHPGMFAERFTAHVANFKEELPTSCLADFWVIIDGVMIKHYRDMTPRKSAEQIDVLIPVGSRFLTLVTTDSNRDNHLDCVNMGDPKLHLHAVP